jgi:hypothetical protein
MVQSGKSENGSSLGFSDSNAIHTRHFCACTTRNAGGVVRVLRLTLAVGCFWFSCVVLSMRWLLRSHCGNVEWSLRPRTTPPAFWGVWVWRRFTAGLGLEADKKPCIKPDVMLGRVN